MDLLVMVPTRGRPGQCARLLESFRATADHADIAFILDPGDEDAYAGVDWGDALHGVLSPRGTLADKLNQTAAATAGTYGALMWCDDDYVFRTKGWDTLLLAALEDLGGHGWVYPDTVRRNDVPEIWACSSTVVQALGWFFPPAMARFYGDNAVGELGKRAGLIRFCPQVVVEHLHYSVCAETVQDEVYREAEAAHGAPDLAAFRQWQADVAPLEVSLLRRQFNRDVDWVTGLIGTPVPVRAAAA